MSSSIKLTNSSGKIVTITNPDTTSADVAVDLLNNAYTIATVDDFGTVPVGYTTVIVKDTDRGGVFNRIASTTANGGTIFDGTTGYSWERQYSGAVNVKWFGADSAGVVDSYSAINDALNYLESKKGGTLYFPTGTYLCSGTLYFGGNNGIIETIKLCGDGHQKVIAHSTGGSRIVYTGTTGFLIGLNVNSSGVGENKFGIVILEDLIFLGTGIPITDEKDITFLKGYRSRPTINRISVLNFANGITFGGTGYYGADYSDLGYYNEIRFGYIYGSHCMKLAGADNTTVNAINIEGNTECTTGILVSSTLGMMISNCLINDVVNALDIRYSGGIVIQGIHSEQVSGIFLSTTDVKGLELNGFQYYTDKVTTARLAFIGSDTVGGFEKGSTYIDIKNGTIQKDAGALPDIYVQTQSDYVYIKNVRSRTFDGTVERTLTYSYQDVNTQQFSPNLCKAANESFVYEFEVLSPYQNTSTLDLSKLFLYATKGQIEIINYLNGVGNYASAYYEGIILKEAYGITATTFRLIELTTIAGNAVVNNLSGNKPSIDSAGILTVKNTNTYNGSSWYKIVVKMSFI